MCIRHKRVYTIRGITIISETATINWVMYMYVRTKYAQKYVRVYKSNNNNSYTLVASLIVVLSVEYFC